MQDLREQSERWVDSCALGGSNDQFLSEFGLECAQLAQDMGASHITVDLQFLTFLKKFSRFGYFHFGPISIDVRLIQEIVERTIQASDGRTAVMDDDMVRFSRVLMAEAGRTGKRRIDELHMLIAFMRWEEGLPGRVFGELGVTPEQVEGHARDGGPDATGVHTEKLYSPEDAADYLGVHVQTVRAWIRSGRLKASRLAGQRALRIRASDLQSVLEPVDPSEI